jgi:hypothetical protein
LLLLGILRDGRRFTLFEHRVVLRIERSLHPGRAARRAGDADHGAAQKHA